MKTLAPLHLRSLLVVSSVLALSGSLAAQWSSDPNQNLAIGDLSGEQAVPKIATTSTGVTYVAWFDNTSGNYDVRLQCLLPNGVESWPHNGILVSSNPQSTSLVDWDLIADSAGNAVVTFTDTRAGSDLDVYAYRIDKTGAFLWGPNGVTLSADNDYEPNPRVCEATDGDFVFVWSRFPNVGDGKIVMQRLDPNGVPRFVANGINIAGDPGESPGFCEIVPAENGCVIVSWVRDVKTFASPRHLRARKFLPSGGPVWFNYTSVFDALSLPIAYQPKMVEDGIGGAVIVWHRALGNLYNSFVQHLGGGGTELLPHNGVSVSTNATNNHLDPTFTFDPATNETIVFWNERNSAQSQWGIYGQRFASNGQRLWGATGIVFEPLNTVYKFLPQTTGYAGGAIVFHAQEITGQPNKYQILARRVNSAGASVWPSGSIPFSTAVSNKLRFPVTRDDAGNARMIWEDDRSGNSDVYGQLVMPHGVLGAPRLYADSFTVSLAAGGLQNLSLAADLAHANSPYIVLGSVSGDAPGVTLGSAFLPLNPDAYFNFILAAPTFPLFVGFLGNLDASAQANATFVMPPASPPTLVGLTLLHAYLAAGPFGNVNYASNAVPVHFVP